MDVQALRRKRETYIGEKHRLDGEVNAFILSHMDEIRDALVVYESGVFEISGEELMMFVRYKMPGFISRVKEEKIGIFSSAIEKQEIIEHLDRLLAAEYCYRRLMDEDSVDGELESGIDGYINLRTGLTRIENTDHDECEINLNMEESEYKTLEGLFSREFHIKINNASMKWYILSVKLEKGLPVFIQRSDIPNEEVLSRIATRIKEEIDRVVAWLFACDI